jgi:hypothetical protein
MPSSRRCERGWEPSVAGQLPRRDTQPRRRPRGRWRQQVRRLLADRPASSWLALEVSCHTWSVRLSDKVSQFESRAPPPQPTRRGPGRRSRSSQRSAIFSRMRVQRSALACFDLARPNASISRLIAESSSSIWTSSSPSCVNSRVSQDGIRSGSITRLGIGRHPAPHLGRRLQGVPIGRQLGCLGQSLAFVCVLKIFFVCHARLPRLASGSATSALSAAGAR